MTGKIALLVCQTLYHDVAGSRSHHGVHDTRNGIDACRKDLVSPHLARLHRHHMDWVSAQSFAAHLQAKGMPDRHEQNEQ